MTVRRTAAFLVVFAVTACRVPAAPVVAPAPTDQTTTTEATTTTTVPAVDIELAAAVNAYRATLGIGPLAYHPALTLAAQAHTTDMATFLYVDHVDHDGITLAERLKRVGYTGSYYGEVAAGGQTDITAVVDAWISSPHHQALLVDPLFDQLGVGVATSATGVTYWTIDFGSSRY